MCSYIREHLKKDVRKKLRDMFIISSLIYKARTFALHCKFPNLINKARKIVDQQTHIYNIKTWKSQLIVSVCRCNWTLTGMIFAFNGMASLPIGLAALFDGRFRMVLLKSRREKRNCQRQNNEKWAREREWSLLWKSSFSRWLTPFQFLCFVCIDDNTRRWISILFLWNGG